MNKTEAQNWRWGTVRVSLGGEEEHCCNSSVSLRLTASNHRQLNVRSDWRSHLLHYVQAVVKVRVLLTGTWTHRSWPQVCRSWKRLDNCTQCTWKKDHLHRSCVTLKYSACFDIFGSIILNYYPVFCCLFLFVSFFIFCGWKTINIFLQPTRMNK